MTRRGNPGRNDAGTEEVSNNMLKNDADHEFHYAAGGASGASLGVAPAVFSPNPRRGYAGRGWDRSKRGFRFEVTTTGWGDHQGVEMPTTGITIEPRH
jgi:hypothetical protein